MSKYLSRNTPGDEIKVLRERVGKLERALARFTQPSSGGGDCPCCERFAINGWGEAVMQVEVTEPVTCFVTATVGTTISTSMDPSWHGYTDPGLSVLFPVGAYYPWATTVGPVSALSATSFTQGNGQGTGYHVSASITFATTLTSTDFVGAQIIGDNTDFDVNANITICPSTDQDTIIRISIG